MTDIPPQPPSQFPPQQQPPPPPPGMPTAPAQPFGDVPPGPPKRPSTGTSTGMIVGIVTGVVVAVFALAGAIFGLTRNDSADDAVPTPTPEVSIPDVAIPEVSLPVVSDAPVESVPNTPVAPETTVPAAVPTTEVEEPTTTVAGTQPPVDDDPLSEIAELFAWTSFSEEFLDDAAAQVEIDQLIVTQTVEAAAHPTSVATLCSGVPMNGAFDVSVVWQFDGTTVQSDAFQGTSSGVGTCLSNNGDPLAAGSYQVFASTADETEVGFVTTFVIGATQIVQSFLNNTDVAICDLGVAPLSTTYYEFFTSTDGPVLPGELLNVTVASIDQDLRVQTCDGDNLENLIFSPNAQVEQPMTR